MMSTPDLSELGVQAIFRARAQLRPYLTPTPLRRSVLLGQASGVDNPTIVAGQGTVALELLDALPEVDAILVPVGGGGLIAGIALAAKALHPAVRVIGVQSEATPAL